MPRPSKPALIHYKFWTNLGVCKQAWADLSGKLPSWGVQL